MYQVLIVDDEPIVKIALRSMLDWSTLGFHICATASNGQEALEMAEKYRPHLIICDLKMPVMDGIELIRTAKDRKMDCEFLVISNYEDFNYVRTALVLGASDYILKVSISLEVGDEITVRGPYGNHFPVEDQLKGKNLLFIAGGIGLAPLRSVINYVLDNRADYGTVDILYGSRSADDLVQLKEIQEVWMKAENVNVYLTIDREQEGWDGHVGFVPTYLKEIGFDTDKTALVCGPPIMIKFVLAGLEELGFSRDQVYTTLELRMKCGVGKCGRCNIGTKYVCKDGPVFRCDELDEMPAEY